LTLPLAIIIVLVIVIVALALWNLNIYKKIQSFSNINEKISNLNVLQDFIDTIGKDMSVSNKIQVINDIITEKFSIKYSTIVIFNGAEYVIKASNVDAKHYDALKNLHNDFPELVKKNSDSSYEFKVSFLKRSKRLTYFLGLTQDGADSMLKIVDFYTGYNKKPKYIEYFKNVSKKEPKKPVILLFDNELTDKTKPLSKFIKNIRLDKENASDVLTNQLKLNISENLFVVTHNLPTGKEIAEIEDLYNETVLSQVIDGKTFSRDKDCDKSKFYGKWDFAKYISNNYETIDFCNFKPLLQALTEIVKCYR